MIQSARDEWPARSFPGDFHWRDFHRISGGNPLLLRSLIDDYSTAAEAGAVEPVPGTFFAQAVTTCLYRVDTSLRNTACALAVLGPHGSPAELADVLGIDSDSAQRNLGALAETGLLHSGWFRHEAARDAVLQSMDAAQRSQGETCVARVLHDHGNSATDVARHLIAAVKPGAAPWMLPTLLEAADRALADDDVDLALDCLRMARDICTDERDALAIRIGLARAGWRVNPSAAAAHLPELTAAALAGRLPAGHTHALVGYLLWFGQVDEALAVFDTLGKHGTAVAGPSAEPSEPQSSDRVRLWMAYGYPGLRGAGRSAVPGGPQQASAPAVAPAQSMVRRVGDLLGSVFGRRASEDVVVRTEQILQGTRLDDDVLASVLTALGSLVLADGLIRAAFWCDTFLAEATQRRVPMWQALFASVKALIETRLGRLDAAEEAARTALTLVSPEAWGAAVALPVASFLQAKTALGRPDEAAAQLSIPVPEAAFQTPAGLLYLRARGQYRLAAGHPYPALDDFHACGELMARWDLDLPGLVPWRTDAAEVYLSLGDGGRARALAQEQLSRVGTGRPWTRGVSLRTLAATVELPQRPNLLAEAVEILRERGHRLELARAMHDLAGAYRDLGDEGGSRTLARQAQQLMRDCGIQPTEPEGPANGDRPVVCFADRTWTRGVHPELVGRLSDAELRVAKLAARGHTNRQIASKLFITMSTVEQHLTRVYRKLKVRRTDLAARLQSEEPDGSHSTGDERPSAGIADTRERVRC
ncbi:LuxR C-terminal-related transcriptional regulator [Streptomyces sp. NPDC047082]|uniref:helix-turn-helix transcriptional regulator n=1 Tax=Streptomyces sp. NPDC047082 TaxID=3155259 RepID=UPI0033EC8D37